MHDQKLRLAIWPCTLLQARQFVQEHHRHHNMPVGGLWAIALMRAEEVGGMWGMCGCAIAGRPVSRVLQRAGYCEAIRVCVLEGVPNGSSMLYARVRRIAAAMGYKGTISYTLPSEGGASLRAAGFKAVATTRGGSWSVPSRPRRDSHPLDPKTRWES